MVLWSSSQDRCSLNVCPRCSRSGAAAFPAAHPGRSVPGRATQHPRTPQRIVVEEDAVYGFQVLLRGFFGEVVEAVQCDLTVFVLDGPQGLNEAPDGVRGYAAVHAV